MQKTKETSETITSQTIESNDDVHPRYEKNLWIKMLIGMFLGISLGIILSPHGLSVISDQAISNSLAGWVKIPGIVFLGLIQMVVIPLILCSIILGIIESGELAFLKKVGGRVVLYFIATTMLSITIGMTLVHMINPGQYIDAQLIENFKESGALTSQAAPSKTFEDLTIPQRLENLIPQNLAGAVVEKNLLQIVVAAMAFGVALLSIPKATAKPTIDLCKSGQAVAMTIIGWAMRIAPLAVFGLLFDITIKLGFNVITGMGVYMLCVIGGLLCVITVYITLAAVIGKINPIQFLSAVRETQLLAFSTSSSAATMPFTLACAEEKLDVRPKIARFIVPLGATINMDGTALYQAVAAVFLVQVFGALSGVDLTTPELLLLMITTVGASIGTPATPGVGIVVLATILTGIGLPPAAVGFILGVDRILDMFRTTVNVTGDLTASVVMNKWIK